MQTARKRMDAATSRQLQNELAAISRQIALTQDNVGLSPEQMRQTLATLQQRYLLLKETVSRALAE